MTNKFNARNSYKLLICSDISKYKISIKKEKNAVPGTTVTDKPNGRDKSSLNYLNNFHG